MRNRAELAKASRVVVKIGSRLLSEDLDGRLDTLSQDIATLRARKVEVVIVTSGAIALGMDRLGLRQRPRTMPELQAAAAVGQGRLMHMYEKAFSRVSLPTGQVLVTHDDIRDRRRYLNARRTLAALLRVGAVPIINENDTVSVDEIKFGDNDELAALTTSLVEADALVILTDVEGLHDRPPTEGGKLIHEVHDIDRDATPVAGGSTSGQGTGGMISKVRAAKIAARFGVVTIVASGRREAPISALLDGAPVGTVFWPSVTRLQSRKHWIAYGLRPVGVLRVDKGARQALAEGKKSLLPSGVTAVEGEFGAGDLVSIVDDAGIEFARGLCAFESEEVTKILGKRTIDLEGILGYKAVDEVIHRDDLVLL